MFDIEKSIADWRRQMLAADIKSPVLLDELETHLRDEIEQQAKSGMSEAEAFQAAVEKIGKAHLLKNEFKKVDGNTEDMKEKFIRVYCAVFPVIYSGISLYCLLKAEMSEAQRVLGLAAVALADIFIWYAPYLDRHLPVVHHKRARMTIRIVPLLAWMICAGFFMNFVLPRLNLTQSQMAVSVLWLLTPAAVIGSIGYGLDNAARRHIATADL